MQGTGKDTFDMAFVSRVLTRRIFFTLIHQQVEKRKIKISEADRTAAAPGSADVVRRRGDIRQVPKGLHRRSHADHRRDHRAAAAVSAQGTATPEKIKEYYDANQAQYQETCLSHILVDDEAKANDLKAQLDKGGDFAELAKSQLEGQSGPDGGSAAKGGSLDCITSGQSSHFVA